MSTGAPGGRGRGQGPAGAAPGPALLDGALLDGALLDGALRPSVTQRVGTFDRFFHSYPGHGRGALGLGTALADFLAWEVDSGRVADRGGSRWWMAVNGLLVLHVALAGLGPRRVGDLGPVEARSMSAVSAWRWYVAAPPAAQQAALWRAHAASIALAVDAAAPLLAEEPPSEQELAAVVLRVLDGATRRLAPTDTPALGDAVRRDYPATYPVRTAELIALTARLRPRR